MISNHTVGEWHSNDTWLLSRALVCAKKVFSASLLHLHQQLQLMTHGRLGSWILRLGSWSHGIIDPVYLCHIKIHDFRIHNHYNSLMTTWTGAHCSLMFQLMVGRINTDVVSSDHNGQEALDLYLHEFRHCASVTWLNDLITFNEQRVFLINSPGCIILLAKQRCKLLCGKWVTCHYIYNSFITVVVYQTIVKKKRKIKIK